jgi:hypothetical protein
MQLDKQFAIDQLREHADDEQVQKAIDELPEKIDENEHADLLLKHGVDPGKLAAKAAEKGIAGLQR